MQGPGETRATRLLTARRPESAGRPESGRPHLPDAYSHRRGFDFVDQGPGFAHNLPSAFDYKPRTGQSRGFGSSMTRDKAFRIQTRASVGGSFDFKDGPGYRNQGDHSLTARPGESGGEAPRRSDRRRSLVRLCRTSTLP